MANAGYDPRDLANVFKTIAQQDRGGGTPAWLSDHPDPGNRYENINREASYLRVSANPIKITRDFERIQAKFRGLPKARTSAEIEKEGTNGQGRTENPTASGRYSNNIQYPSNRFRTYSGSNFVRLNVPSNWREFPSQDDVQFAPEGAYGEQGITHGAMIGIYQGQNNDVARDSQDYVNQILQGNSYLRQRNGFSQINIAGQQGYATVLAGRSPITGRTEVVTIYTTQLRNGGLFYADTVVPEDESQTYSNAFRTMLNSIRLSN